MRASPQLITPTPYPSTTSPPPPQLTFEIERQTDAGQTVISSSKLSLVDLAGSEKMQTSGGVETEKHVRELTSINSSLHCLGNVIAALSAANRPHVPYRDSKLTRLLQVPSPTYASLSSLSLSLALTVTRLLQVPSPTPFQYPLSTPYSFACLQRHLTS